MTYNPQYRTYGHAACCRCACMIDLAKSPPAFFVEQGNLHLYFWHCPSCYESLLDLGEEECRTSISKALGVCLKAMPGQSGLAITSSVALQAHHGDLVKAYEIGVALPRWLHDAIVAGETEVSVISSDIWEVAQ